MSEATNSNQLLNYYRQYIGDPDRAVDVYAGFGLFFVGLGLGVAGVVVFLYSATLSGTPHYAGSPSLFRNLGFDLSHVHAATDGVGADVVVEAVGGDQASTSGDDPLGVATGRDEGGVEVVGSTVGRHADDTVARGGQPVVGRHLERTRVGRGDVVVAAGCHGLDVLVHVGAREGRVKALVCEPIPRLSGLSGAISADLGFGDRSAYVGIGRTQSHQNASGVPADRAHE